MTSLPMILVVAVTAPLQAADTTEAYLDPVARTVVERAKMARFRAQEAISSYEARMSERAYVGLGGTLFRRERGLLEQKREADVRWEREGERVVRWIGGEWGGLAAVSEDESSTTINIGTPTGEEVDEARQVRERLARSLLTEGLPAPLRYGPGDDRLEFGGGRWILDPLSDTAAAHYRYRTTDTLSVAMPAQNRELVLIEIDVIPRRDDPHLVAGVLLIEESAGHLARTTYKLARPWNLARDEPGAEDAPPFAEQVEAEIRIVTIEYTLQREILDTLEPGPDEWWLPRRFAFEGEGRFGGALRVPIIFEWSLTQYEINPASSRIPSGDTPPEGWSRSERMVPLRGTEAEEPDSIRLVMLIPPTDSLRLVVTPEDPLRGDIVEFDEEELEGVRDRLDEIADQVRTPPQPDFDFGLLSDLVRYNRVEGLSVGARYDLPVGRFASLGLVGRFSVADAEPRGEISLTRGDEDGAGWIAGYRRLRDAVDWGDRLDFFSSLKHFTVGADRGQYFDALGGEVGVRRYERAWRGSLRGFYEEHRAVRKETNFHILRWIDDDELAPNIEARQGAIGGLAGRFDWSHGLDPRRRTLAGSIWGEAADGDFAYQRLAGTLSVTQPLTRRFTLGLGGGLGAAWDEVPVQREFYLGGSETLRGFSVGDLRGSSFWFGRIEVARGLPSARIALFTDAAWAGPRQAFGSEGYGASVGVGLSVLDGILRADLARQIEGGSAFKLHLYLDGIF